VCNEKQVDTLLVDMIGNTEILFNGTDAKRKYSYDRSIKNIQD